MRKPMTVATLTGLGRERLSKSFFMRDFLFSDIAAIHGFANVPDDPDLAIAAGTRLCEDLLEPIQDAFGRIAIRSAYRSKEVNGFGNEMQKARKAAYGCASNKKTMHAIYGISATITAAWVLRRVLSFRAFGTDFRRKETGKNWRGGFMITCLTHLSIFIPPTGPSISIGMRGQSERSRVIQNRKVALPSLECRTIMAATKKFGRVFWVNSVVKWQYRLTD